jgi:hypothetical protein
VVFPTVFGSRPILDGLNRLCDRHLSLPGEGYEGTSFTGSGRVLHAGSTGEVSISTGHRT